VTESWCVLLASRQSLQQLAFAARAYGAAHGLPAQVEQGQLKAALRRAASIASRDKIAAAGGVAELIATES